MEMELKIAIKKSDYYDYKLYRTYTEMPGIIATMFGVILMAGYLSSKNIIWLLIGGLLIISVLLYVRASGEQDMRKNKSLLSKCTYRMSEEGIVRLVRDVEESSVLWEEIKKAVSTPKSIFLIGEEKVMILPKGNIINLGECIGMISIHISPDKVKIKP